MTELLSQAHIGITIALFLLAGATIAVFGIRMTYLARDLAVATGLGEAFMGAVFIGATTSLSGIIASATAAWEGQAGLAVSNSLGGIAAQTLFLVLADLLYRKANLEFAAASVENMMMSVQLMLLLCILLVAFNLPDASLLAVHPASVVLVAAYLFTLKLLVDTHEKPMWMPRMSPGTVSESRKHGKRHSRRQRSPLVLHFALCATAVGLAGWVIANCGIVIVEQTGLSAGITGGIFIAVSTSLPELVVAVTAIRMGALTLAVGDIVGGNAFDTLFVAVSDFFYREGPIFSAIDNTERVWLGSAMLMNTILLMGLMYRERRGIANIGMESALILLVYVGTVLLLGAQALSG
ncbi:sodium:calcium antiporter [Seongchinamella sediminis]|uniref:Sodium:calcium antiporter n=1 Tax=Seongchinamella sediminis TaxID=2283635 RepID=A0A3L7E2G4_9GAMM|nr:sodium:calcium antiporter [Seongchinamella sediminis]RLQ22501.1 sodium:calcium antiporter [Seongchinamella sediminis]